MIDTLKQYCINRFLIGRIIHYKRWKISFYKHLGLKQFFTYLFFIHDFRLTAKTYWKVWNNNAICINYKLIKTFPFKSKVNLKIIIYLFQIQNKTFENATCAYEGRSRMQRCQVLFEKFLKNCIYGRREKKKFFLYVRERVN